MGSACLQKKLEILSEKKKGEMVVPLVVLKAAMMDVSMVDQLVDCLVAWKVGS